MRIGSSLAAMSGGNLRPVHFIYWCSGIGLIFALSLLFNADCIIAKMLIASKIDLRTARPCSVWITTFFNNIKIKSAEKVSIFA